MNRKKLLYILLAAVLVLPGCNGIKINKTMLKMALAKTMKVSRVTAKIVVYLKEQVQEVAL